MIIRYREDPVASGIMLGAILLLAGTLGFMLFAPRPVIPGKAERIEAENKVTLETETAKRKLAEATAYNATRLWTGPEQTVGTEVFASVNRLAKARGLNLQALRPQRVNDQAMPVQLPYTAIVEGSFPNVLQFIRDLETPANKVAVSSVMMSSADTASDKVTGSIGIVAYLAPTKNTIKTKPTTTKEPNRA